MPYTYFMFVSVDIGGTHTRVGISADGKKLSRNIKYKTPGNYDDGLLLLVEKIEELANGNSIEKIVIGIAGILDLIRGKIDKAPNLSSWTGHMIRDELSHMLHLRVAIENDAALAGLAEANARGRKKYPILAYVTISTGVGGARIENGRIDKRARSFEPGHMILDPNGRFWPPCGQTGCFESFSSGLAFEITYGIKPELCEDSKIWEEHAQITAQGLINVITTWSPDILVIGGSMIKAGDKYTKPLINFINKELKIFPAPVIEISKLGDDNGLLGGLIYLKS